MTAVIHGYASIFNHEYPIGGGKYERVAPTAFKRTLGENPDVQLNYAHAGIPMARTKAGTMTLETDSIGLKYTAQVDETRGDVSDLLKALQSGAVDQASFAFVCTDDEWDSDFKHRIVRGASLARGDISVVAQGANELAWSQVGPTDLASRRAAAQAIGKNFRGTVSFTAHMVERYPSPERRAMGERAFIEVTLEPRALALPNTSHFRKCARCSDLGGKIVLNGRLTTCPNCKGAGRTQIAADAPHMGTSSDGNSRARRESETRRLKALGIDTRKLNIPTGGAGVTVSICRTCGGAGRLAKPGGGKSRCDDCHGSGRVASGVLDPTGSNAGLTVKPCPSCNGVGRIIGPTGGKTRCPDCAASGSIVTGKLDPTKTRTPSPVGARSIAQQLGIELRAKYTDAQIEKLGLAGKAFLNPDGHYSFPVDDAEDLQNAIRSVGRSGADHDKVRGFLVRRAKAMGLSNLLPDLWNSDGSVASGRSFHY